VGAPEVEARHVMDNKDAFDLWWEWAEKPVDSTLTIDAAIHDAVMALPPDERRAATRSTRRCATDVSRWRLGRAPGPSAYPIVKS
jgi:hypothetical protein